jgi:hypothetical protein
MPYVLAAFALIVPIVLVVQTIRGRVRIQCCSCDPANDARMAGAFESPAVHPSAARER